MPAMAVDDDGAEIAQHPDERPRCLGLAWATFGRRHSMGWPMDEEDASCYGPCLCPCRAPKDETEDGMPMMLREQRTQQAPMMPVQAHVRGHLELP
jgi:hypothetical protein